MQRATVWSCRFSSHRHDTLGLLLAVVVTAANVHDSAAATQLLTTVRDRHPTITKARADNGYKTKAVEQAAHLGIDLEIVQRDPNTHGFHVQPRRWVIERTLGWLMHHRRLARDYETHPPPISRRDPTGRHQPHDPPPHPRSHHQLARQLSQMKQTTKNQTLTKRQAEIHSGRLLKPWVPRGSTRWPFSKWAPARTNATRWGAVIARQRACADSASLRAIASAAAGLPAPRVTLVRTVAAAAPAGLTQGPAAVRRSGFAADRSHKEDPVPECPCGGWMPTF